MIRCHEVITRLMLLCGRQQSGVRGCLRPNGARKTADPCLVSATRSTVIVRRHGWTSRIGVTRHERAFTRKTLHRSGRRYRLVPRGLHEDLCDDHDGWSQAHAVPGAIEPAGLLTEFERSVSDQTGNQSDFVLSSMDQTRRRTGSPPYPLGSARSASIGIRPDHDQERTAVAASVRSCLTDCRKPNTADIRGGIRPPCSCV